MLRITLFSSISVFFLLRFPISFVSLSCLFDLLIHFYLEAISPFVRSLLPPFFTFPLSFFHTLLPLCIFLYRYTGYPIYKEKSNKMRQFIKIYYSIFT